MPAVNVADLLRLREQRQWSTPYLVVQEPETMWTGTVNDPYIMQGEQSIDFDAGAAWPGYTASIFFEENATLWVGSTVGDRDTGIVRAKDFTVGAWPYTVGTLKVAENSDIQWRDNLYLTLKDEHRVWPRFPRVALEEFADPTGTVVAWWKDYDVVYDDQNIQEPPVVVMGPPAVEFLDAGVATVYFWGEDSYSPRNTALSTPAWTFPHGTPATAATLGTYAAPHTVTWNTAGTYMVRLQITDANGHISNGYRPVFIVNRTGAGSPYTDFEITSMSGSFDAGGWTASFRIFAEADVTDFPEGALIVIFAEDWYNSELVGHYFILMPLLSPDFEVDSNADGLADNWTAVGPPVALTMSTTALQGLYSQQVVTNLNLQGLFSTSMIAPAGIDDAVAYIWMLRTAGASDIRAQIRDTTAGVTRAVTSYNAATVTALDKLGNTWYQLRLIASGNIIPGNNHQLQVYSLAAGATTWLADKAYWKWGTTTISDKDDWPYTWSDALGGYGYRGPIVFVGWIKADSVRKEPETGEITFDAHTTHGELQNCPSFPISVDRVTTTPTNWNEIHDMNLNLAAFHVGYWHSTMYEVADVLESDDERVIKYLDIPEGNIYNQLDRTTWEETIFARTLVDRQGRIKYDRNPQYLQPYERGNLDTIMTLTNDDWLGVVDAKEVHEPRISWIDASGVRVASWEKVYPVFSMAPGVTPKPDGTFTQLTNVLVSDQHDMDRVAGYALANANKMHPNRTLGLAEVTVPLQGNYRIFDIQPQEWVLFPSLDTLREGRGPLVNDGTPWPTGTRFIPRDIDLSFDNTLGCFLASIGLEPETIGPSGTSVVYPGQLGSGASVAIVVETMRNVDPTGTQIDRVFVTREVFADSPTWYQRHNGLPNFPPPGGRVFKINNLEIDPFSNGYDGTPTQALIATRARYDQYALIYHNADLYSDMAWVHVLDIADVLALAYGGVGTIDDADCNDLKYDRTTSGWAYAIIWVEHIVATVSSYELLGFKTINHGLTWTFVANISAQVGGAAPRDHNCGAQCFAMTDPFDPNYMYAKVDLLSTGAHDWRWIRSIDKGVTWTSRMGGATTNTVYLHPAQNSDDAWYDPAGSGWSLGFFNQVGVDIAGNCCSFTVRYPSAGIGQNAADINSAHVHIKAFTSGQLGGAMNWVIYGIDESWLPTFTTRGAFDSWDLTTAHVHWNAVPNFTPGTDYQTPDLTTIIQELTSRANWDSTCAIGLLFELDNIPTGWTGRMRVAYNYEDSPADTPRLDINYDCAALTTYPSVPAVLFPRHSRDRLASYWGLTPPSSDRTNDGWASRYYWYALGAGDGPVSMVEPLYGSYPMVYLTDVQGTDPDYTSYVHTSLDGESWSKSQLLPVQIAQAFRVWPWMIEGADTLMYVGSRTGDGEAPMDHYPYQFWISEDGGDTWQEKTGNLNTLMDSLSLAKDRTERIRLLEINIVF